MDNPTILQNNITKTLWEIVSLTKTQISIKQINTSTPLHPHQIHISYIPSIYSFYAPVS